MIKVDIISKDSLAHTFWGILTGMFICIVFYLEIH